MVEKLNEMFDPKNKKGGLAAFLSTTQDSIKKIFGGEEGGGDDEEDIGDKLNGIFGTKSAAKLKPKANELIPLGAKESMGYLLLYWKLDTMHKDLLDWKNKKGAGGSADGGGGLTGLFTNFFKGAGGLAAMAGALIMFAGALAIFQFVNWPAAIMGMTLFAGYIVSFYYVGKYIKDKGLQPIIEMAKAAVLMSAALGIFAISLWLMSMVMTGGRIGLPGIGMAVVKVIPALLGIGLFLAFIYGIAKVGNLLKNEKGNLKDFALASFLLSAALGIFAISLWITSAVVSGAFKLFGHSLNLGAAITGTVAFLGFILGIALISKLIKSNEKSFSDFAKGALLLTIALGVFAITLYIVSQIFSGKPIFMLPPISMPGAILGLVFFGVFLAGAVLLGNLAGSNIGAIQKLGIVALILSGSLILFGVALWIIGSLPPEMLARALGGMTFFAAILAGAILVGKFAEKAIMGMVWFGIAAVVLSISLILFGVALKSIGQASQYIPVAILAMVSIVLFIGIVALLGAIIPPLMPVIVPGLIALGISLVLLLVVGALMHVALIPFTPALATKAIAGATVMASLAIMMVSLVVAGMASIPAVLAAGLLFIGAGAIWIASKAIIKMHGSLASIPNDFVKHSEKIVALQPMFVSIGSLVPYLPLAIVGAMGSLAVMAALTPMLGLLYVVSALFSVLNPLNEQHVNTIKSLLPIYTSIALLTPFALLASAGALASIIALPFVGLMLNQLRQINTADLPSFEGAVVSTQSLNRLFLAINSLEIPGVIALTALAAKLKLFSILAPGFNSLNQVVTSLGSISGPTVEQALINIDNINLITKKLKDISIDSGKGIVALQKAFDNIKFKNIDLLDQKLKSIEHSLTNISGRKADMDSIFGANSVDGGAVAYSQRSRVVTAANPEGAGDDTLGNIYSLLLQWYASSQAPGSQGYGAQYASMEGGATNSLKAKDMQRAASSGGFFKTLGGIFGLGGGEEEEETMHRDLKLNLPLARGYVTADYKSAQYKAWFIEYFEKEAGSTHHGMDFGTGGRPDPVLAVADGRVESTTESDRGFGCHVIIRHRVNGKNYFSYYCHMAPRSICVSRGDIIRQGQKVGIIGTTGTSSAVHLHFELRTGRSAGSSVDPKLFFTQPVPYGENAFR